MHLILILKHLTINSTGSLQEPKLNLLERPKADCRIRENILKSQLLLFQVRMMMKRKWHADRMDCG